MNNLDFLNQNSLRSYPIREDLSQKSVDSLFTIPNNFMVDLMLCTGAAITTRFYISKVSNFPEQIVVEICDDTSVVAGTFSVPSTQAKYTSVYFVPTPAYATARGKLTIGFLNTMASSPIGIYTFLIGATELEMRTVIPALPGVNSLTFTDTNGANISLTGDVQIKARSNLRFRYNSGTVYMDAGNGLGLNNTCQDGTIPITSINGVAPDSDGNFTLSFTDCGTFVPSTNGLILDDSCSRPCLGCAEIETLTVRTMQVESDLIKLRTYYDALLANITQLGNVVNYNCELP